MLLHKVNKDAKEINENDIEILSTDDDKLVVY